MASIQRLIRLGALLAVNPVALVEDAAAAARRTAILIVCALVAGLILLPGVGCLMAALWIFVQHRLGPVWAGVVTAAAFFLLAILILVIGLIQSKSPNRDRRAAPRRGHRADPASLAAAGMAALPPTDEMIAQTRAVFRKHKSTILMAAGVAGLVLGQNLLRPRTRYVTQVEPVRRGGWLSLFRRS
jgi:hypothetical protein